MKIDKITVDHRHENIQVNLYGSASWGASILASVAALRMEDQKGYRCIYITKIGKETFKEESSTGQLDPVKVAGAASLQLATQILPKLCGKLDKKA